MAGRATGCGDPRLTVRSVPQALMDSVFSQGGILHCLPGGKQMFLVSLKKEFSCVRDSFHRKSRKAMKQAL